jgi:hypothetical protein
MGIEYDSSSDGDGVRHETAALRLITPTRGKAPRG